MAAANSYPALSQENVQHCRRILDFWHQVEFFIPFDLQQVTKGVERDDEWSLRYVSEKRLRDIGPDSSADLWQFSPPPGKQLVGFDLYLGVFNQSEMTEGLRRAVDLALSEKEAVEQKERGDVDSEGLTCCARVGLDKWGASVLGKVSVSTVPWALGRIQQVGLGGLDFDTFQEGKVRLETDLTNFRTQRANRPPASTTDANSSAHTPLPMTGSDLLELLEVFYQWAAFRPSSTQDLVMVIRARAGKSTQRASSEKADGETEGCLLDKLSSEAEEEEEEEGENSSTFEIDILNSFYAKDIERVIQAMDQGRMNQNLLAYLVPRVDQQRTDLYTEKGRERILKNLHPKYLTAGRWLGDPSHSMSLMQQFAINNVFQALSDEGLFSVNGPPGTGKTTLLREIFAENITRRARVLARFTRAQDALLPGATEKVTFDGVTKPCFVAKLHPELTGFEMVVASSNNRAVENISRDLPKAKSLGAAKEGNPWRTAEREFKQKYLQPVAHRIAAQKENGAFEELPEDETPWGLISCVLGKQNNRWKFAGRIGFPCKMPNDPPPKGYIPEQYQSLWEWRDRQTGPEFKEARREFLAMDQKVATRQSELARYADLANELHGHALESYTKRETFSVAQAEQRHQHQQTALDSLEEELRFCQAQLTDLERAETLIQQQRPPWWRCLLRRLEYRQYLLDLDANHGAQRSRLERKLELQNQHRLAQVHLQEASTALEQRREALSNRQQVWKTKQAELTALQKHFPQARRPERLDQLEENSWQIQGVWRDDTLNQLRSELFAAALALHQAWLGEVLKKGGGFGGNVIALCHLLSGKRLSAPEKHTLPIWQSLFMIVPVVSSTFASIGNQFRHLEGNTLGWLFIDEAGQAVPQAAVGALWRARRAVVVGDPLQIEPVFSVPFRLIEALNRSSKFSEDIHVEPHRVSAQNLSDASNELGTWIVSGEGDDRQWIGSPLRVHRRCYEPMFSIANSIAYGGKMVYGLQDQNPPPNSTNWGDSAWVNVTGTSEDKVVPEQIELVVQAMVAQYQAYNALPLLYIISPFKKIKGELIKTLTDRAQWKNWMGQSSKLPKPSDLDKWCHEQIGTVHTFQGKEEGIVWMVLGCSADNSGAVVWASSKPNLLNVAVTRAQYRIFLIGDVSLWGGKRYFVDAYRQLPVISEREFLRSAVAGRSSCQESTVPTIDSATATRPETVRSSGPEL